MSRLHFLEVEGASAFMGGDWRAVESCGRAIWVEGWEL